MKHSPIQRLGGFVAWTLCFLFFTPTSSANNPYDLELFPLETHNLGYTNPFIKIRYRVNQTLLNNRDLVYEVTCHAYTSGPKTLDISQSKEFFLASQSRRNCKGRAVSVMLWEGNSTFKNFTADLDLKLFGNTHAYLWIGVSSASVFFCVIVVCYYLGNSTFRRFPNNLVFWRTIVDMLIAISFIVLQTRRMNLVNEKEACTPFLAAITQFSLIASACWYAVLGFNFYVSISNPFRKPQSKLFFLSCYCLGIFFNHWYCSRYPV